VSDLNTETAEIPRSGKPCDWNTDRVVYVNAAARGGGTI